MPEPDGPTSATVRPGGTARLTPLSTEIFGLVGEGDVVELDLAALQLERLGIGRLDQLGLAIDNAEHPARRRHALLQLRLQGRGTLERTVDQERRGHEAHELAEAEIAAHALGAGEIDGERKAEAR